MLLQRLGYSDTIQINFVAERTFELHELKYSIRQAAIQNDYALANALLHEFEEKAEKNDCISKQFIVLYRTILSNTMSAQEKLHTFVEALLMTCPRFFSRPFPDVLSYEEIIIINNIASCQATLEKLSESIDLLYGLKRYYENRMVNQEEILRTQPMILYNLSNHLGRSGRYDECIEICNQGIRIARETGRCTQLDLMFYNKAWALHKRGNSEDCDVAKESIRLAICMAEAMGKPVNKEHYVQFMQAHLK